MCSVFQKGTSHFLSDLAVVCKWKTDSENKHSNRKTNNNIPDVCFPSVALAVDDFRAHPVRRARHCFHPRYVAVDRLETRRRTKVC